MGVFQADITRYVKINQSANCQLYNTIQLDLNATIRFHCTLLLLGNSSKDGYLPGGVMQSVCGHHVGRIKSSMVLINGAGLHGKHSTVAETRV